jgi:hypothetical protein
VQSYEQRDRQRFCDTGHRSHRHHRGPREHRRAHRPGTTTSPNETRIERFQAFENADLHGESKSDDRLGDLAYLTDQNINPESDFRRCVKRSVSDG